jgi:hypothetical protein
VWLRTDFREDPQKAGWRLGAAEGQTFAGSWESLAGGQHALAVEHGWWESPPVPNAPFEYFRLTFHSKAKADGYWAAFFSDAQGNAYAADCYDSVLASEAWQPHVRCFRGHALATHVRLRFQPIAGPIAIRDVCLERIRRAEAAMWADAAYAELPPVRYVPPPDRWRLLPRTMRRLREGGTLRVVLLGDSIANDTAHSAFDVLLERDYPKCRIEAVNSVRGGTGCPWYQEENRMQEYVVRYRPDLLIVAGISHGYDPEAMRRVIRQVRAAAAPPVGCEPAGGFRGCEFLVLSDAICSAQRMRQVFLEHHEKAGTLPREKAIELVDTFPARLRRMAEQERVELVDLRAAWDAYLQSSPHPHEWVMRDPVHANTRGKLVVGRILLSYLAP